MMISDLADCCGFSVPTITKYISELLKENLVMPSGKIIQSRGKHPAIYKINPNSKYFAGVDIKRDSLRLALVNLAGDVIKENIISDYHFSNSLPYFEDMKNKVLTFLDSTPPQLKKQDIPYISFNIFGRVDSQTGTCHSFFNFEGMDMPLAEMLTEELGIKTIIENDTKAMTFGYLKKYNHAHFNNFLFVNISYGLGLGIVMDGKVYRGKNGYSGEFGHINAYNNEVICHCGKKGCLETEVSGYAANAKIKERYKNGETTILSSKIEKGMVLSPNDFLEAVAIEDPLSIDIVEKMGIDLGKQLANLINIFNPEAVVIGGSFSEENAYFLESVKSGIRKYSLKLLYKNLTITQAENPNGAGVLGACMIGRDRFIDEL